VIGLIEEEDFDMIKKFILWKNQRKMFNKEIDDKLGSKRKQNTGVSFVCKISK
jgi:hypothetical protein